MQQWVYIYKDLAKHFVIGVTADIFRTLSTVKDDGMQICYLRPFDIPFDAMAHKKLLDSLTSNTIKNLIKTNKIQTSIWLDQLN